MCVCAIPTQRVSDDFVVGKIDVRVINLYQDGRVTMNSVTMRDCHLCDVSYKICFFQLTSFKLAGIPTVQRLVICGVQNAEEGLVHLLCVNVYLQSRYKVDRGGTGSDKLGAFPGVSSSGAENFPLLLQDHH